MTQLKITQLQVAASAARSPAGNPADAGPEAHRATVSRMTGRRSGAWSVRWRTSCRSRRFERERATGRGTLKRCTTFVRPRERKTPKTRVGRGEGSKGKTAGRGTKGTGARKNVPARFEGGQMPLHMRVPKLKGFRNRFRVEYQVVNLTSSASCSRRAAPSPSTTSSSRAPSATAFRSRCSATGLGVKLTGHASTRSPVSATEKISAAGGSAPSFLTSRRIAGAD